MPKATLFRQTLQNLKTRLARLSMRTGLVVLALCVVCYVVAFAQIALPLSATTKGALWVLFFGMAKALQYTALAIMGKEGVLRLRQWWKERKKRP